MPAVAIDCDPLVNDGELSTTPEECLAAAEQLNNLLTTATAEDMPAGKTVGEANENQDGQTSIRPNVDGGISIDGGDEPPATSKSSAALIVGILAPLLVLAGIAGYVIAARKKEQTRQRTFTRSRGPPARNNPTFSTEEHDGVVDDTYLEPVSTDQNRKRASVEGNPPAEANSTTVYATYAGAAGAPLMDADGYEPPADGYAVNSNASNPRILPSNGNAVYATYAGDSSAQSMDADGYEPPADGYAVNSNASNPRILPSNGNAVYATYAGDSSAQSMDADGYEPPADGYAVNSAVYATYAGGSMTSSPDAGGYEPDGYKPGGHNIATQEQQQGPYSNVHAGHQGDAYDGLIGNQAVYASSA